MHQLQAGAVAVLQVGELVGEHDRVGAPVAVEQRDRRVRRRREHGGGDREHRGDPGAGDDEDVVLAGHGEVGGEAALRAAAPRARRRRRAVHQPGGEQPGLAPRGRRSGARPPRARRSSRSGARRVRRRSGAAVSDWPARKRVVVGEVVGDVEGDRDGVVGEPLDAGHPQRVEAGRGRAAGSVVGALIRSPSRARTARGTPAAAQRLAGGRRRTRESSSVSGEPHSGQSTRCAGRGQRQRDRPRRAADRCAPGGAMPASASLRRPSSVIQSVVHGGGSDGAHVDVGEPGASAGRAPGRRAWRPWPGSPA